MLRPVSVDEMNMLRESKDNRCSLEAMLKEFIKMNIPCVEVKDHGYASVGSGVGSIRQAIRRWHFDSLEVFNVDDEIYLVNNNIKVK